ncbi:MFS transporter [Oceanobacillus senegalensis]|uniref:MFS transporter n=1 Tax=Oceanobacillus senegalensis TaxID=1936063 RepID=UPI000A30F942|nr:MFS transporter [Oceanobacillus senegalensis]
MSKEKLWTKEFIFVSLINFIVMMVYFVLIVTIAPYAVQEFNAPTSVAGLVSGIFIIGSLVGRLITGRTIQDRGSRQTILVGLTFFIITTALYYAAINLSLLLIIRLLHGIAVGVASTAAGTIVAQIIPKNRRGEGIGYFSMTAILGSAIGPFIGILFTRDDDYISIFLFNLILAIICLVMVSAMNIPGHQTSTKSQGKRAKGLKLSNFIEPRAVPISFVALVIGFAYSGIMSFLSFYMEEIQLEEAGGFLFLVYATFVLLLRPFTGKLMDQKGPNIVVYPCLIIFALGMLVFSQAHHGVILLVAAALIGLGYGNFVSIVQAIAIKVTPPNRVGLATSTYFILYELGLGIGPFLLGFLVPITGYRGIFLSMVFVILVSIFLYYILHGKKERASNQRRAEEATL